MSGGIALTHGGITLDINGLLKEDLGIFPSGNHQIKGQMQWCQLKEELGIFPQGRYQIKWKMPWCQLKEELGIFPRGITLTLTRGLEV